MTRMVLNAALLVVGSILMVAAVAAVGILVVAAMTVALLRRMNPARALGDGSTRA